MLKKIEEFGAYVEVAGYRDLKVGDPNEFLRSAIRERTENIATQLFDAENVASWQHLYFAALNALTVFGNKTNISRSLGMEILLYSAAERQIAKATRKMGIKRSTKEIAVLTVGDDRATLESAFSKILRNVAGCRDDTVLELSESKYESILNAFNVDPAEVETIRRRNRDSKQSLVDLIIERMALVSCER